MEDEGLRIKMATRARQTVEEKFTWEKIALQFEKIYSQFRYSTKEYFQFLNAMKGLPSNHKGI